MSDHEHESTTKGFFDQVGSQRAGYYSRQMLPALVQTWVRLTTVGMIDRASNSLLDVCCGRGDFTADLALTFPQARVAGVDYSAEMLRHGQSLASPRLDFRVSDMREIQHEDRSFETVICLNAIHHLTPPDIPKAVAELARVATRQVILEIKNSRSPYHRFKLARSKQEMGLNVYGITVDQARDYMAPHGYRLRGVQTLLNAGQALSPIIVLDFAAPGVGR